MIEDIVLIDLFSGIGGFTLGLEQAGFNITHHYFSEIDKNAVAVYKYHFKKAEYVGSVIDVSGTEIRAKHPTARIIICFGWPCQDNSIAGKRKGHTEGTRSNLLVEAVRIIQEVQPDYFIAENVKGLYSVNDGVDFIEAIRLLSYLNSDSPQYEVEQQLLNTSWFLPQNRERTYFVGYPRNRGCRQILPVREGDKNIDETRQQSGKRLLVNCIDSNYLKGPDGKRTMIKEYTNLQGNGIKTVGRLNSSQDGFVLDVEGLSKTLSAGHFNVPKIEVGTLRTHKDGNGFRKMKDEESPTIPALAREDGSGQPVIMITSGVKKGYEVAQVGDVVDFQNPKSKTRKGRVSKEKTNTLDTGCHQGILTETTIRRLTEIECERLQGFPDDWTKYGLFEERPTRKDLLFREKNPEFWAYHTKMVNEGDVVLREISPTQRYRQVGNAVSVPVVKAVGERILMDIAWQK